MAFRVLMVAPRLPRSGNVTGSPAHVRKLRRALEGAGAEVALRELDLGGAIGALRAAAEAARLARDTLRAPPDLLYCHGHVAAAVALPAAWLARVPAACEVHGLYVPSRPGQPGARPLLSRLAKDGEGWALRRADLVIAQARAMAARLETEARVPPERIVVLYPGLDTEEFSGYQGPIAAVPGRRPGERVVMYVGSTHAYQGLDLLAAAQRSLGPGHRLALVLSSDAADEPDPVRRFGFDPAATTVARPESPAELPGWLAAADVLVHARPDVPDNLNVQSKLGLYLASGRPIAATDVGDYAELLSGVAGCVLAPPEPEALARSIARALGDPEVVRGARDENRALARRHFEAARNATRLLERCRALGTRRTA